MNKLKKNLLVIICICFMFTIAAPAFAAFDLTEKSDPMFGDVSMDGKVALADVQIVLSYCTQRIALTPLQTLAADVNCDGHINTGDVTILLKHIVGMIKSLPYTPTDNQWETPIVIKSSNLPKNNKRLSYGRSFGIDATIVSETPLTMVRIRIFNRDDDTVEIDKKVTFAVSDRMYEYNTKTSRNPIDSMVKFSSLSTGPKKLQLICSSKNAQDLVVVETTFRVGITYSEIAGHVYSRSDEPSAAEARNALFILNSLDYTNNADDAMLMESAIALLGKSYRELDCSKFVQAAYKNGLGVDLPRTSVDQAIYAKEKGYIVSSSDMRTGDIIFMTNTGCDCGRYHEIHHSALYLGSYDGIKYIIESATSMNGVIMRRLWGGNQWHIDSVARICK